VVVVLAAAAAVAAEDPFGHHGTSASAASDGYPTALTPITKGTLNSQIQVSATLGYTGSYTVKGSTGGVLTWVPGTGSVIRQGQVLYRVNNGTPVILLYGAIPDWRELSEGLYGADVKQLNRALVALKYASRADLDPDSNYFSAETAYALELMQAHYGLPVTGDLPLGQLIFLPSALMVTSASPLGSTDNGQVLAGTSTSQAVTIALNADQQSEIKVGDQVSITLPNGNNTPGVISSVGTVATSSSSGTTINVTVSLSDPGAAGDLVAAPVQVSITTQSVSNVLEVPVDALLATPSGGYAVEETTAKGSRRLVPVTLGLFDDAAGTVQISGSGLAAGQEVVVPQI
jgi:hypothetical protein